jgi:hypothetical protein
MSNERMIELANLWRHHRVLSITALAIIVLAAIIGLGVCIASVLHVYSESHYDYVTSAPTPSRHAGLS